MPALFGLGREMALTDQRFPMAAAWLAAVSLAVMRWHIIFSRVGIEPILVPLFLVLILWAFWRAWRTGRWAAWVALGVTTGLGVYTYPGGRLLPVVTALLCLGGLVLVIRRREVSGRRANARHIGVSARQRRRRRDRVVDRRAVGLELRCSIPTNSCSAAARSQSAPAARRGRPGTPAQNVLATLGMFNVQGDRDPRSNVPGMPAFDLLIGVPFLIGAGLALWRWKRPVFGGLLLAGLVMLAPTVFSEYAPHFRRAVGVTPVAALLIGLGLAVILGRPQERAGQDAYVPWRVRESGLEPAELSARMNRLRWWGRVLVVAAILFGSAIYSAIAYFDIWGRAQRVVLRL